MFFLLKKLVKSSLLALKKDIWNVLEVIECHVDVSFDIVEKVRKIPSIKYV